jgi:hypothetical protein
MESFDSEERKALDGLVRTAFSDGFPHFVDYFARYKPSLFIIIRYNRARSALTNLHRFFAQDFLVQPRTPRPQQNQPKVQGQ